MDFFEEVCDRFLVRISHGNKMSFRCPTVCSEECKDKNICCVDGKYMLYFECEYCYDTIDIMINSNMRCTGNGIYFWRILI